MPEDNPVNVTAAFEILLEEIEAEIEAVNEAGAKAFATRNYPVAQDALKSAEQITDFRSRVAALRQEWIELAHGGHPPVPLLKSEPKEGGERRKPKAPAGSRRNLGHLRRGLKTPDEEYRLPILQALAELNGSAPMRDVLDLVHKKMKSRLNDVDLEGLPSNRSTPRWRNTAQWARNTMAREGLLKSDSRWGVWEISEEGQRVLSGSRKEQ